MINQIIQQSREERCRAEVSISALRHNIAVMRELIDPGTEICAVVKANAYGHGAPTVAKIYEEEGINFFAVSCLSEAMELRQAGINSRILILGPSPAEAAEYLHRYDIRQIISSRAEAEAYIAKLPAASAIKQIKFHIKLDTGMSRYGFPVSHEDQRKQSIKEILSLRDLEAAYFEGIFTHFATASAADNRFFNLQKRRFNQTLNKLEEEGMSFPLVHCANSAATVQHPHLRYNLVRCGVALLGGIDGEYMRRNTDLRAAMSLKARLSDIRQIRSGDTVSYSGTYKAEQDMRIGVVEIGYADGLMRSLSNKAIFALRGKKIRQIGNICMDRCMVDLSEVPEAEVGDYLTIYGGKGDNLIDVEEQAQRAGTICYELFTLISERVPRIYVE